MTRYLLDTNIISDLAKSERSSSLLRWLGERSNAELFIASLTVAEISRGILIAPRGRKRDALEALYSGPEGPEALFASRILPFDIKAAHQWARSMAEGRSTGRPRSGLDTIIAAVAVVSGCIVATDNERDFVGISTINPLRDPDAPTVAG